MHYEILNNNASQLAAIYLRLLMKKLNFNLNSIHQIGNNIYLYHLYTQITFIPRTTTFF